MHRIFLSTIFVIAILFSPSFVQAQDLYRFYSPLYKGHFYTASHTERDRVLSDSAWRYEGVAYSVQNDTDDIPIYRFWSPIYKHHFFTASATERDRIRDEDENWLYEGQAFLVASSGYPVYRFWSPRFRGHFYTTSQGERDSLISSDPNWNYEGIAWNVSELAPSITSLRLVQAGIERKAAQFDVDDAERQDYPDSDSSLTFPVLGADLGGAASALDQQVWDLVRDLAPTQEIAAQLVEISVYYEEDVYAGYVRSVGGTLDQWSMELSYGLLEDMELFVRTVVHEYAHIMAVQDHQVTTIIDDRDINEKCTTYLQPGICYGEQSYLQTFYEMWQVDGALIADNRDRDARDEYYNDHDDQFVSVYATRNLEEDFAETLDYGVFGDVSTLGVRAQEKVRRTLSFPDLALYQSSVRALIAAW